MSGTDIDKVLSTIQAIAWVWMCMHYLVQPVMTILQHNVLGGRK